MSRSFIVLSMHPPHALPGTAHSGIPSDRVYLEQGNPATEIKAKAEQIQADLIVIGTHGRHGLGLLLGSTANGVLHGVECDVLTVRIR